MDAMSDPQLPAEDEVMIRNTSFRKLSSIDSSPLLKIRCSGGLIQVHQRAIASVCPHFEILSLGDKVILEMTNILFDDFEAITDLSLYGQCVVKRQNLKSLENAAERLGMRKLRDIVSRIIAAESVPVFTVKIWEYNEKLPAENIEITNDYYRIKMESDINYENPNSGNGNEDGDDDEEMDDLLEDEIVWGDNDEPLQGPSHRQNSKEEEVARPTVSSSQNSEGAEQCPANGEQSEMTPNRNGNVPDISRCETLELTSSQDRHSQYKSKRREGIDESKALKRSKPLIGEESSSQKRGEDQVDNRNTSKPQSMPHHQHHHSRDRLSSSKSMNTRPKSEPMKEMPSLLSRKPVLQPLDKMDILAELPVDNHGLGTSSGMQKLVEETKPKLNPLLGFTSRKARTTVCSGPARTTHYTHVLKLEELCLRVLMDNIDKITYLGYAPYYLMKPVLKKCTPEQLSRIEEYNPDLVDEDDELWKEYCDAQFRGQSPLEFESFRELFIRCQLERDMKLKRIAGNIRKTAQKAKPERRTMLAYVNSAVKPPESVLSKQEKFGTAASVHFPEPGATGRGHSSSVIKVSGNIANGSLNSKAAMAAKSTGLPRKEVCRLKIRGSRLGT